MYEEDTFLQLFKQVLKLCIDKGLVNGYRQAIDSVYIKANASLDSLVEKEVLDDATTYNEELSANEDNGLKKKTISYLRKKKIEQQYVCSNSLQL